MGQSTIAKEETMIRNLKALVLALVAVFAMSAVAGSVASTQQGESAAESVEGVTLLGSQTGGGGSNALTAFGIKVECWPTTYTGHQYGETPHALIPDAATTFTLTPDYSQENCLSSGFPTTIDMNGCDYVLHIGETTPSENKEGTYGITFDIVCPAEKAISVTVFTNSTDHKANTAFCTAQIKPQTGLKGAHVTDTGNGYIDVTGTIEGMHIEKANHGAHTAICPNATTTTGKLDVDMTFEGHGPDGTATEVSLLEEGASGQGQLASKPLEGVPLLTSDGPVTLTVSETGESNLWKSFGLITVCPAGVYPGHRYNVTPNALISNGATKLTLTPLYKSCSIPGLVPPWKVTVDMNGCDFVLHMGSTIAKGTYGVTTDIVCPPEKSIMTTWFTDGAKHAENKPFCKFDIKEQTGLKGAHATDTGNGLVDIAGTFTGIHILRTSGVEDPTLCPNNTTTGAAEMSVDLVVEGRNALGGSTPISLSD